MFKAKLSVRSLPLIKLQKTVLLSLLNHLFYSHKAGDSTKNQKLLEK